MSEIAIKCVGLGKRYRIGQKANYSRFSDLILGAASAPFRAFRKSGDAARDASKPDPYFWALRDVSFEIPRGQAVGIIGRNGAGKSTLLKIFSRITEPTEGRVEVRGRIGSLLEVGTGFHPELSGRDNIFLNAAILGMRRSEIIGKFDQIVEFAEVGKFLDTAVKHYSSGMYTRLAFAVAAHLEPDILLVDEVLAVGDAAFQKKCLAKMSEVARGGRTVLFVSHNMGAISSLCATCVALQGGRLHRFGPTEDVVKEYLASAVHLDKQDLRERPDRQGSGEVRFVSVEWRDGQGEVVNSFVSGWPATLRFRIENKSARDLHNVNFSLNLDNANGATITHLSTEYVGGDLARLPAGCTWLEVRIPRLPLMPGRYRISPFLADSVGIVDWVLDAAAFDVNPGDYFGNGRVLMPGGGDFMIDHQFVVGE